jgi:hypothetical protein
MTMDFMGQDMQKAAVQQHRCFSASGKSSASDRAGQGREDFAAEGDDGGGEAEGRAEGQVGDSGGLDQLDAEWGHKYGAITRSAMIVRYHRSRSTSQAP